MSQSRATTTVVLWHGQYSNDGRERLATLKRNERTLFGLRNPRLIGNSGNWRLIADADCDQPRADDLDLECWTG